LNAKIDYYVEALLSARPALPKGVRGSEPVRTSLDRSQFLERARKIKDYITDGEVYQLQLGIRFTAPLDGSAFDLYRAIRSRATPRPICFTSTRPLDNCWEPRRSFWCA
jgi:anthranilate/para-aminobenzoate synthase component I